MNRLRHSFSAYRRSMQVSQHPLHIFVESYEDRFVYGQFAELECQNRGLSYEITTADQLSGRHGGGKAILLEFFDYLKRTSSLINKFAGKTTIAVFFLDKDIDDFIRTKRRSRHVVYTETYQIENYLFMFGRLSESAAASACIGMRKIASLLGNYQMWRKRVAEQWKEWVVLCMYSRAHNLGCGCTYSQAKSPIHAGTYGGIKPGEHVRHILRLQKASGLDSRRFRNSLNRLSRKVDKIYAAHQHDRVFKGRWYACFLAADIARASACEHYASQSMEDKILSCLALSLNFSDPWSDAFRIPLRNLLNEAGL